MGKVNKNPLILIVDDVEENLQVLGNTLNKNNYRISFATNGNEALNTLKKIEPQLILLDIMMPGLDGFETCKQIKANEKTKDIPIIFLTAKTEQTEIVKAFNYGAVDYVKKPFNTPELLARIKTHIELHQAKNTIARMKEKEMFNAMVITANHQINQPLTALTLYLQLIEDDKENVITAISSDNMKKMYGSIKTIKNILVKLREIQDPEYTEYVNDLKMVDLDK